MECFVIREAFFLLYLAIALPSNSLAIAFSGNSFLVGVNIYIAWHSLLQPEIYLVVV
jgi:hypothetical protein